MPISIELSDEDKVDLKQVAERLKGKTDLTSVMTGNNSESDKKDWFKKEFGEEVSEYYGDRLDFYKKIMNPKVFPMILEGIYKDYNRDLKK